MWPVVTFRIRYPVGIELPDGSAVTAAGLIWIHVPGVPACVHLNSPARASRQNSARTRAPEVGEPMTVVGGRAGRCLHAWRFSAPGPSLIACICGCVGGSPIY